MSEVLKLTVFLSLMSNDNWIQACIATFLISALPAILLIFVPLGILKSKFYGVKFLNVLLSFAAGGLLGDVFIHAIPHLLLDHAHEHAPVDLQDPSLEMEDHHPEDHHHQEHGPHGRMIFIGISVLFGFFLFFIADRIAEYHMFQRVKSQMKKNEDIVATDANISPDSSMDMSTPSKMLTRSAKKAKKEEVGVDAKENSDMVKTIKKNSVVGSFSHMAAAGWLNMMADTMHNFTDGIAIGVAYNSNNPSLAFATTLSVMVHEIPHVSVITYEQTLM